MPPATKTDFANKQSDSSSSNPSPSGLPNGIKELRDKLGGSQTKSIYERNPKSGSKNDDGYPAKPINYICADFSAIYNGNQMLLIFDGLSTKETTRRQSKLDLDRFKCEDGDLVYLYDEESDQRVSATLKKREDGNGLYAVAHFGDLVNLSVSVETLRKGEVITNG